jgi:hypothetical protein
VSSPLESLKAFSASLRRLPRVLGQKVASAAAPVLTETSETTFRAGEDPYGNAWAPGEHGDRITLVKTGALSKFLKYVAIGEKLRVALGVPYAKYQIGKRPVFPRQGGALPVAYRRTLEEKTAEAIRAELGEP